ncbi:MAG: hypothetical protein JKY54_09275 [Flavobacteriales bacterium]|nr:hypothetical protein [Flavobacteriales bacterium]
MKTKINITLIILITGLLFSACKKREGCMNPLALNYDSLAKKDCCCAFSTEENNNIVHSGAITTNETWLSSDLHELAGKVIVENGVTLTIQPGTIIKGRTGTGSLASALIISKGAMIDAQGTASLPIIFTSTLDNIEIGQVVGTNLDETDNEKWGGIIVLGDAPISAENGDTQSQIEGIPAEESYGSYGGNNPGDNSGILTYISIRHGGTLIGEGNEINGLTLGGVGSGTVINNIEVIANLDDGIECFGGTVNLTNVLVAYQGDDGIDLDQNYSGTISNFIVINDSGDEGLEIDGPEGSTYTSGMFHLENGSIWTTIGNGSGADLKSKAQGSITNTYWSGWNSNSIKIRASFSDTSTCTEKEDANAHITNSTPTLTITNSEIVGTASLVNQVNVYTNSMSVDVCTSSLENTTESVIGAETTIVSSSTTGAVLSSFGWTWASIKGKL